jgi:hypothetical protein
MCESLTILFYQSSARICAEDGILLYRANIEPIDRREIKILAVLRKNPLLSCHS